MSTPVFPDELPGVSTLDWSPESQLSITDADLGPKAYRRVSRVPSAIANVSWRFLENDFAVFQEFWKTDLKRGHKWFTLTLPCGAGFADHVVRFLEHRSSKVEGYNGYRTVNAQLYVRERKLRPDVKWTWVTTAPYPLVLEDRLGSSLSVLSGTLSLIFGYADDSMDLSATVLSGTLRSAVVAGFADDRLESSFVPLAGSLVDVLLAYDNGRDEVQSSLSVLGGTLTVNLVQNNIPVESLDLNFSVLSGTLT